MAGEGVRMKSYGVKALLKLSQSQTLLDYQLQAISKTYRTLQYEVVLVAGFESRRLMNKAPQEIIQVENEQYLDTHSIRSLGIGLRAATNENVIVIHGDLLFNSKTLCFPHENVSKIVWDKSGHIASNKIGCTFGDNTLENMWYDIPNKWAQIAYFTGKEAKKLRQYCWNEDNYKKRTFESINHIVDHGGVFKMTSPKGMVICEIDTPTSYKQAVQLCKSL
jgi:hypothetical protein